MNQCVSISDLFGYPESYLGVTSGRVATTTTPSTPNPNPNVSNITTPSVNTNSTTISIANIVTSVGNLVSTPRSTPLFYSFFSSERSDNRAAQKGEKRKSHFREGVVC
ncbi:hypothetical protein N7481_008412 [Penicillium waksmanii]|uniref:uncharacterized protein n=1 Tax=Penicillium waksmanii TaxID=69791 RepID=UPI0025466B4A|nr:uncharacterized protein N7481_008412 [Penicillium waksmanii]KAJ5981114.1 hypothetical protein N7481_008412 [Penicillium waksmanii]